jgi:2-keto-4-pentenoate hydratase/2-oxohepta-3-ene-1,7-dioic acid hydratase in catechol pathway
MRWATYRSPTDAREHLGLVRNGKIYGLRTPARLIDLLGDDGELLFDAGERAIADPFEVVTFNSAALLAPIPSPPSVRDFYAFESHVTTFKRASGQEMDPDWYELPVFYFQNPAAVTGPREDVKISPGCVKFDYELEVAAVIGKAGSNLSPAEAEGHIAGYMVLCDWSGRDLQSRESRQGMGPAKGKDSATSFGPYLVTPDELEPQRGNSAFNLRMSASVNGTTYSEGNLDDLFWSFGQMIAYASRGTRVVPGDIIGSGTVGTGCILELSTVHGTGRYPWLKAGDEVLLEVEHLGGISCRILPSDELLALR